MDMSELYDKERVALREELHNLKNCQNTFLTSSITVTEVILGIATSLIQTPFLGIVFLFPLIVLLPSWWVFFDKATTITRIAGFGEEFGWRGFMFPQLCQFQLLAGFVIGGLIWFVWHVPLVFIMPSTTDFTTLQHIFNGITLAIGSICTFVFFAYVYAKSGSIWVVFLVHAVFNNGSRPFSYFANVKSQLMVNIGLMITMISVVAFLYFRKELAVFENFLPKDKNIA